MLSSCCSHACYTSTFAGASDGGSGGGSADAFAEFGGIDPNVDPEMAQVMRISLMEQREAMERASRDAGGDDGGSAMVSARCFKGGVLEGRVRGLHADVRVVFTLCWWGCFLVWLFRCRRLSDASVSHLGDYSRVEYMASFQVLQFIVECPTSMPQRKSVVSRRD